MSDWVYLWHWSPRQHRHSIRHRGLRTMTWQGLRLVLFACTPATAATWREHITDRHGEPAPLDGWLFRVRPAQVYRRPNGMCGVLVDVPSVDVLGPAPVCPEEAVYQPEALFSLYKETVNE